MKKCCIEGGKESKNGILQNLSYLKKKAEMSYKGRQTNDSWVENVLYGNWKESIKNINGDICLLSFLLFILCVHLVPAFFMFATADMIVHVRTCRNASGVHCTLLILHTEKRHSTGE
jgi:hypothetical protein